MEGNLFDRGYRPERSDTMNLRDKHNATASDLNSSHSDSQNNKVDKFAIIKDINEKKD